jgi:hypothetical protein
MNKVGFGFAVVGFASIKWLEQTLVSEVVSDGLKPSRPSDMRDTHCFLLAGSLGRQ